jgi:transposase-like protein
MNLSQITKLDENESREYLESIRWSDGALCPHCGSKEVKKLDGKSTRPGVYKCKAKTCRKQFTVTVGTIFERSHIPLRHWCIAFHMMCASKKGVSAHQLHRQLGCTYKTSWFMCHRIRHAMTHGIDNPPLKGKVEVDETYVGGRTRLGIRGLGSERKTPVVALIERDGRARAVPVEFVDAARLRGVVRANVDKSAKLFTDELGHYRKIGKEFAGHETVTHSKNEYVRGNAYTNTAESFFALLKRGVHGTFHQVSVKHLHRYCEEFAFRWSNRKVDDGQRTVAALRGAEGKRLTYRLGFAQKALVAQKVARLHKKSGIIDSRNVGRRRCMTGEYGYPRPGDA